MIPDAPREAIEQALIEMCGRIRGRSAIDSFSHSSYYAPEMGEHLQKYYLVFDQLITPSELVWIKHATSVIERRFATSKTQRLVNIDPGYFTHAQLVLATHKNYAHRVYLDKGVYAELTYVIQGKSWTTLPWTYPDYCRQSTKDFFLAQRNEFVKETKQLRPRPGDRIPLWTIVPMQDEETTPL